MEITVFSGKGVQMNKNRALKVVNLVLLVLIINQMVGAFLYSRISHELFVWGHERAGILLAVVAAVHLALNWNWVKANYFKRKIR